jgi:carbon storage regulator
MLVLGRKIGEEVVIGDSIRVFIVDVRGDRVRLGFEAPREVPIYREEVLRPEPGVTGDAASEEPSAGVAAILPCTSARSPVRRRPSADQQRRPTRARAC